MTTTPDMGRGVQIDLRRALRWRWPVLLCAAIVGLLAGSLVAALRPPGYEATAVTAIVPARADTFPGADYVSLAAPSFIAFATSPTKIARHRAADRHRRGGSPIVRTGGRPRNVQHDHRDGGRRFADGRCSSCELDRVRDDAVPRRGHGAQGGRRRGGDYAGRTARWRRGSPAGRWSVGGHCSGSRTGMDAGATPAPCRGR